MDKSLSCRDVGADCGFSVCAATEDEVLRQAADHARKEHDVTEFSEEMKDKARSAIREGC
jgi:predicted small metal-binding protein